MNMTLNLIATASMVSYFGLTMVLALAGVIFQDMAKDESKSFSVQS